MFNDIETQITHRVAQTEQILKLISDLEQDSQERHKQSIRTQKGLAFISMYASIEFAITQCVIRAMEVISRQNTPTSKIKDVVLCSVLDNKFSALRDCPTKNVWLKKYEVIQAFTNPDNLADTASINCSTFPGGGAMNIDTEQFKNIWFFFDLQTSPLPSNIDELYLGEVKENRNSISHGRERAVDIGKRYTLTEVRNKSNDAKALCYHVLSSFQDYINNESYLKTA